MRELGFIALMYVAYAASRVFADDSLAPARDRAMRILVPRDNVFLDVERDVVAWFVGHDVPARLAAYYYASAHYLVTAVVLLWLYRRRVRLYPRARQVLIGSTLVALVGYLLMPTAPPRLVGFPDLMAQHADSGWWGEAASAPQGMGWLTNQLAAFPSMHAGWALWVALAVTAATTSRTIRTAAWAHALSPPWWSSAPAITGCSTCSSGGASCSWRGASPSRFGRARGTKSGWRATPTPISFPNRGPRSSGEPATFQTVW